MTKTLFIPAIRKITSYNARELKSLPNTIHILYTIQYKELAERIKSDLTIKGKKILAFQQILGCSKIKPQANLLLIGSGRFHAINIAHSTNKEVFVFDGNKLSKITQEEIERYKAREKAKISKFLLSDNIGLLVSNKPGQNKLKEAIKAKKDLEESYPDKNFYLFIADNISVSELENFQIDIFLNFACPGLALDSSKILNQEKILK